MICEYCKDFARDSTENKLFLKHHESCPHHSIPDERKESYEIVFSLINIIDFFIKETDGLPDEFIENYKKALFSVGKFSDLIKLDKK